MTRRQDRQRTGMRTAHGPRARGAALLLSGALGPGRAAAETPPAVEPEGPRVVENVVVYYEPGRFAGWPANNGLWSWGNENAKPGLYGIRARISRDEGRT